VSKQTNTGTDNSGNWNSGNWNSGDGNSGDWNSGYGNSGNRNSGYRNSGNRNSGDWNSGNWNSGYRNSGNRNSGDWNSGYGNSGNRNSGDWNSTDRESGIFNSLPGTLRMFNKPTDLRWGDIDHPHFRDFYLNKWVPENDMTDEEKKADPEFYVRGGYLRTYTYKEAWANFWRETDEENRQKFLNLPNFDAEVFYEITGVDVRDTTSYIAADIIELNGKRYKLIDEAA
jgi:hypothetical protein